MGKSSSKRLEQTTFKLQSLLNITLAINENLSQEELLHRYESLILDDFNIGKLLLYKFSGEWSCILASGVEDDSYLNINVEEDLTCYTEISFIASAPSEALQNFDIIIPVHHKGHPLAYVVLGDLEEGEGVSPIIKHLNFVQTLSNIILVAIENIRLFNESLRQQAIRKELELASKMQNMLIPDQSMLPQNDRLLMTAFYHPHLEVGGDYYDYISLSKNEFGFCIADVSGKGMSAALLMSNFQANLRAMFTQEISLEALVEKLNERVIHAANGEKFITLFLGRYSFKTRELLYINAGHNRPMLYLKNSKEIVLLDKGCVGMGMVDDIPFISKGSIILKEPAKILCYTDGLVELLDGKGVTVETTDIESCLKNDDNIYDNINDIIDKQGILDGSTKIFDDISMLGIEIL